jgi:hypothetical protein
MSIPGANLLAMALTVIAKQQFTWNAAASRALQANGQYLGAYAAPVTIFGSAQPAPHDLIQQLELDFTKNYYNFYCSNNIIDAQRDVSGDQIVFQGTTFQCIKVTPWFGVDGWNAVLAVQV